MNKPSKTKYAITNRTRQILTLSFVALGSFLVFTGSKCNDTTQVQHMVVGAGAGLMSMQSPSFCLSKLFVNVGFFGAVYGGGNTYRLLRSNAVAAGLWVTNVVDDSDWIAYTPKQLLDNHLDCSVASVAIRDGYLYLCSFNPERGPGPFTLYNCGYDLYVRVFFYGVTGGLVNPPPGATINFSPPPGGGGGTNLPDLLFASIPLTSSTTFLTVPTSMPQGLYDMTTTDDIICGITNLPFSDQLQVVESDSTGIHVEINCILKP
jgi:hypothetical protein